jgi:hypothetical protein
VGTSIGQLPAPHPPPERALTIAFPTGAATTAQRRRIKNVLVACLADSALTWISEESGVPGPAATTSRATVAFIANELLENGMKYNFDPSYPITISLQCSSEVALFTLMNTIDPSAVERLQSYFRDLLAGDPLELYLAQLEQNAREEDSTGSRVGILSMRLDYGAALVWEFQPSRENGQEQTLLKTMVHVLLARSPDATGPINDASVPSLQ